MCLIKNNGKSFFVLFIVFFISSSTLLLNFNGVYWDDWTLVNQEFSGIHSQFSQNSGGAGIIVSALHYVLINELGVFSYRVLTFLLWFLSGFFIFRVLASTNKFSNESLFFVTVFYLLAPHFSSRVALIDFPYVLFVFIFYLSFYLLSIFYNNLTFFKRIIVLMLFFSSFLVNSLLVFYAVVLLYLFYFHYQLKSTVVKNLVLFLKLRLDFILLPVVFYVVKLIYFKPSGLYAGYNEVSLIDIFNPIVYIATFNFSFFQSLTNVFPSVMFVFAALPLAVFLAFIFKKYLEFNGNKKADLNHKINLSLFILGIVIFSLGAMPYIATGKAPVHYGLNDRFQVLLPLGFSLVLWFGIKILFKRYLQVFIAMFFVVAFVGYHIKEQLWYNIDYYHQLSIVYQFEVDERIINNHTFIVDNQLGQRLKQRGLNVYELNGMAKLAHGEDSRLFVSNVDELNAYKRVCNYVNYNCSSWYETKLANLTIRSGVDSPFNGGIKQVLKSYLKIKYYEFFDKEQFDFNIQKLVTLDVQE